MLGLGTTLPSELGKDPPSLGRPSSARSFLPLPQAWLGLERGQGRDRSPQGTDSLKTRHRSSMQKGYQTA